MLVIGYWKEKLYLNSVEVKNNFEFSKKKYENSKKLKVIESKNKRINVTYIKQYYSYCLLKITR